MARCPACFQGDLDPSGACPSCGGDGPGVGRTLPTLHPGVPLDAAPVAGPTAAPPAPPGAFRPGAILGGRYQVLRPLGRGGIGEVWQALDLKLRVVVALKSLRAEWTGERMRERLRREVRAARDVVSPNVCRIFDMVELDGHDVVTMEFVDGLTLAELLRERGPLPLAEAAEIASQFLAGLEAIHQAGFVHCDLKPENLMLTRAGRVVVMDFGLARPQAQDGTLSIAGTPAYMAPEQVRGTGIDARADLFASGLVLAEMVGTDGSAASRAALQRAAREDPPRLPDGPWRPALLRALAERREARWASARELLRALEQVALRVPGADERRPYPGLAAFTAADAEYFFGRELEVEALWQKLGQAHLLAVIGPSGAGKSSFLRAGLLPALPRGWHAVVATPGTQPFVALAQALADEFAGDADAVRELLRLDDPEAALAVLRRWRGRHAETLLVLDQFEELFTLSGDDTQRRFAELLGRAAVEADVRVLLSLRDDFLVRCHEHAALQPIFADLAVLRPPTGAALRRAVVQPALLCGYRFEDEDLAAEMIEAVTRERGALPLLAFAAARLWDERDRASGLLTREAYARIGGVGGALAQHAEATVERIGAERLPVVRELFRNLVTAQGTRIVRDYDELLTIFGERRAEAETVLRALIDARLLTEYRERGEPRNGEVARRRVEIIHESLLSSWPRLERWQAQDAEGALLRDQLRQAAATWEERGRAADLLWAGTAYQEFSVWQERYPGALTATEQAFADAMRSHAQRRRRRQWTAVGVLIAALVAVIAVVTVLRAQSENAKVRAEQEARRAQANELLALARTALGSDSTEALALARKSLELADTPTARKFVAELLWRGPVARILSPEAAVKDLQRSEYSTWFEPPLFSPDGRWIAALNGHAGRIALLRDDGSEPLLVPAPPPGNAAVLAFGPRSDTLVSGGGGAGLTVRSLPDLGERGRIELGGVASTGWLHGERLITATREAAGSARTVVRSWPIPAGDPQLVARYDADGPVVQRLSPDGRALAYERDRMLFLGALATGGGSVSARREREVGRLETEPWDAQALRFQPDGRTLMSMERSGAIRLWSLGEGAAPTARAFGGPDAADFLASSADGSLLARVDMVGLSVWNLDDPPDAQPLSLRAEGNQTFMGAFDPANRWLAVSNANRFFFWPVAAPRRRALPHRGAGTWFLRFSRDGRWLVSCAIQEPVRLWPLDPRDGSFRDLSPRVRSWSIAVNDSSTEVLVGTWAHANQAQPDGRVFLYPIAGGPPRQLETGWEGRAGTIAVAIDAEGRRAAACPMGIGADPLADPALRVLSVWDLATGRRRTISLADAVPANWFGCDSLEFGSDGALYETGPGGVFRIRLLDGLDGPASVECIAPTTRARGSLGADRRTLALLSHDSDNPRDFEFDRLELIDLASGEARRITTHGPRPFSAALDPTGRILATGDFDGVVRVGRATGEVPHLLPGHTGMVESLAISPDGRWIASVAGNELFLWPMPDLDRPPLHTVPRDRLLATLDDLTNLRVVADASSATGWSFALAPFPGWKEVPNW